MNIFNRVTIATLKKNRTRTIVTVIGVILSAAMICAVTTSIKSLQNYLLEQFIYSNGSWHGAALDSDGEMLETVKKSDKIKNVVWSQKIGYVKVESTNKYKPYLYIMASSENFADIMSIHITDGRYPTNKNEIILPMNFINNGNSGYKLGDVVTYDIGRRLKDGVELSQQDPYYDYDYIIGEDDVEITVKPTENAETFEVTETRTYTVVGFYEVCDGLEEYLTPGYVAITASDNVNFEGSSLDIYFTMKKAKNVYSFMNENNIVNGKNGKINSDVLMCLGLSQNNAFNSVLYGFASILIGLIMLGSISLIYNAFSISVSERTKQFGLLSSIGATRKQLSKMVFFEAFVVSLIGIPIGVIAGVGGIGVTLSLLGEKFASFGGNTSIPMTVSVSYVSIGIAAAVALVTVIISAWIPSKRATKICAVEAIRQNNDIKIKDKNVKTSRLTYKLFGLSGVLAPKYFKRSRKKYRTTVVSLFMSIVLFISAASLSQYFMWSVTGAKNTYGFDVLFQFEDENGTKENLINQIKNERTVTSAAYVNEYIMQMSVSTDQITKDWLANMAGGYEVGDTYDYIGTYVCFVDDDAYREFLHENKLDENLYMNSETPLGIAIDGQPTFSYEEQKYYEINLLKNKQCQMTTKYSIGDEIKTVTHNVGTVLYDAPYFAGAGADLILLYPNSVKNTLVPEEKLHSDYSVYVCSSNHKVSAEKIEELCDQMNIDCDVNDYAESIQTMRDLITILKVFSYGFIVLISLIAAANVFNTISTNISLRRREFAVLKSVGMTNGDFNKMMNYECLLYGTKSLLYGLPVSFLLTYLIHNTLSGSYQMPFKLPLTAVCIAVFSVFAVVFTTMLYSMRKIKKDNPIDALKNENL